MEMLLMGACLAMFGLAVACLTFKAATREETRPRPESGGHDTPRETRVVAETSTGS